jgi:mannose-6-phosphate isomerase class I
VRFFGGDLVGMIVAEYLGSDAVVVPVTCNDGIDRGPLKSRLEPRTRIGSPYVIAGMEAARRKGKKAVCGWEANGGFLTGVDLEKEGRPLRALPTRDAFLPILAVLVAAGEKQVSLCTLFDRLPRRYSRAGLLKKFPRATSLKMLERLSPLEPSLIEAGFFPELSPCLDLNGLPLRVAAREVSRLCEIQQELEKVFSPSSGFAPINRINWTDGLRIHFANHDVAHVRPSGNADELRIYSVADSRDRAEAIVQAGVREPDGLLRRLESWIGTPSTMSSTPGASLLRLEGAVQNYEWGGFEFIPELLGMENLDRKPFGELWLGAHPKAPAQVIDGSERIPLNQLLERDPVRFLGETASARFNKKLPFLLKILDARQMLSIQAHPNKQQAVNGFARENVNQVPLDAPHRNYRDDNHKPEAHLALTEFWMLHGFRPAEEVAALWESTPEFHALAAGGHLLVPARSGNVETQANPVRELYAAIMRLPQVEVNGCLRPLCQRLDKECPSDKDHPDYWAWRAFREFPLPQGDLDRGIFSIYLLNLLHLHPGEGTYQPAGILHAYLEGTTVEIMANSDNVLRGGLTAKHVDISELLRIVTFAGKRPDLLKGEWTAATRRLFQTPAEEFELSVIEVTREQVHFSENRQGAEILISMEGAAILHSGSEVAALPRGAMVFLPSGVEYHLRALTERAVLYQAGIPAMRRN